MAGPKRAAKSRRQCSVVALMRIDEAVSGGTCSKGNFVGGGEHLRRPGAKKRHIHATASSPITARLPGHPGLVRRRQLASCAYGGCDRRGSRRFVVEPQGVGAITVFLSRPVSAGEQVTLCGRHARQMRRDLDLVPVLLDEKENPT